MFEIAFDIGGTFSDAVLRDEEGKTHVAKFPTDLVEPQTSMMGCIRLLAQERGLTDREIIASATTILVGTTLASNCLVEGKGAKCCMLYTKGFRDVLELGSRIPKDDPYDLRVLAPEYLVPRFLRFPVEERVRYNGEIITPLNEDDVREAVRKAKEQNVEVPVVCFLHSYINPQHEEQATEIIKTEYPNVVVSSHILPRHMEGHRFHTAVLAAYVKPVIANFVGKLEEQLNGSGFKGTLLFMTCAGGLATPELCLDNPALMIGSGPAGAVLCARQTAKLGGWKDIASIDMGGTSVDLSILPEGKVMTTTERIVANHRNAIESVDVTSIGGGGGAIAWIDQRGILRVGPEGTSADPGPACYGKGGQRPTLTDADVVLGYIPADYFLGGRIPLNVGMAEKAIEDNIAKPLDIDVIQAANAILRLSDENTGREILLNFIKKGLDPREFVLVVGGGAGPVHAAAWAERLSISRLCIAKDATCFAPMGMLLADYKYTLQRFCHRSAKEIDADELAGFFLALEEEGVDILKDRGIAEKDIKIVRGADVQYYGQLSTIDVILPGKPIGEPFTEETVKLLIDSFHERHKALCGHSDPSMAVTIETLKLHAIGLRRPVDIKPGPLCAEDPSGALKRKRQVYFKEAGGFIEIPCYDGDRLRPGNVITGPAIVEETGTTVVIPPEYELTVDAYGNYDIIKEAIK